MDKLYTNGIIVTMDDALDETHPEAVLVRDGLIQAVGSRLQLRELAIQPEIIDLQGKALYPAFIDAHSHYSSVASGYQQIDLSECTSFEEIQNTIRQFIEKTDPKPGTFLNAKGYDHNHLKELRHPTKQVLDAVTGDHPCMIQHQSGHFGVLNSRALEYFHQDKSIKTDAGELNFETGYASESIYIDLIQKQPMTSPEDLIFALKKAQEFYASHGITTIQEGMMVKAMAPIYHMLKQAGFLKLDLVSYPVISDADALEKEFPEYCRGYENHIRFGGRKIILDGSPQGRTAWMKHPYLPVSPNDDPDYCSSGTMETSAVIEGIKKCADDHVQMLAHANGDAAVRQYIDCMLEIEKQYPDYGRVCRPVIIHAQLLDTNDLDDVKTAGLIPSYFVSHVYHWGDVHITNFGKARADCISPAKSTLEKGIPFTFHCDSPVIDPNLLEAVWCAVRRTTKNGVELGKEQEGIDVRSALKAVTINAAWQYHEEASKGTIVPGKRADLVILDQDPLSIDPKDIRNIRVISTIKDGSEIFHI